MSEEPDKLAGISEEMAGPAVRGKSSRKITGPADEPVPGIKLVNPLTGEFWQVGKVDIPTDNSYITNDIYFGVVKSGSPIEQQNLRIRVDKTLSALKLIYPDTVKLKLRKEQNRTAFMEAFDKLEALSKVGLAIEKPDVNVANAALDSLQTDIVDREGGRVKNTYMQKLGIPALAAMLVFTALYLGYEYKFEVPDEMYRYRHLFLVLSGCMVGTWVSFAARKVKMTFFDLAVMEHDRLDPNMRLIFTGALTLLLALVITTGMVDIVIGGFKASALLASGSVAVLVGAFAGLTEQTLPTAIMDRAKGFMAAVNKN